MNIGVIDYGAGNIKSVATALEYLGGNYVLSADPEQLKKVDRLIFPGVGEARAAMQVLTDTGLDQCIREFVDSGNLLLGICLGSQIIFEFSHERNTPCLGLIPGEVKRFPPELDLKVPHMGWNTISKAGNHWILSGIPDNTSFYFVHSYYPAPEDETMVLTRTEYGIQFASGVCRENVIAFQFHPEKSGPHGLQILRNFIERKE
jgi:glutamine amidotransferase